MKKTDLLIIMPAFASNENVEKHLNYLSGQTFKLFNVLVIAGVPFDEKRLLRFIEKKRLGFGVIVAKENDRRGCSGAVFAGQKYALEKGYGYTILCDDDCMPVDPKLVENLYAQRHAGYVACTRHLVIGGYRRILNDLTPNYGLLQYCLISTALLRRHGLYFMPLFHGADDGEYASRIEKEPKALISNYVEHPYIAGMRLFSMFDRSWLFILHSLIIMRRWKGVLYDLAQLSFFMAASLLFLPKYGRKLFAIMTGLLLSYTYGKEALQRLNTGYADFIEKGGSLPAGAVVIRETDSSSIDMPPASKLYIAFASALRCIRKDVVVENSMSFFGVFAIAALARTLRVRSGDGRLLLASNKNPVIHALKIALLPFICAAYFLLMLLLFVPIKILRQPRTEGYGL